MPEGITVEDLGKCDHAIRIPDCRYEIGVVRKGDKYILLWDYWKSGGLQEKIGENGGTLKQAYTICRIRNDARRKKYRIQEKRIENGVRLVMTV